MCLSDFDWMKKLEDQNRRLMEIVGDRALDVDATNAII